MSKALCLLVWNEAHGCNTELPRIDFSLFDEVFAVDGGSTDGTVRIIEDAGIKVYQQEKPSYNAAYSEALKIFESDAIILYHPKGTINPQSLKEMVDLLDQGFDLVVASRMMAGAINEEDHRVIKHRKWFGRALSIAASLRWRQGKAERISDPLHGYRGCSRRFAESLSLRPFGVTADLEMVRHAYQNQMRIAEFPVEESIRREGVTHFPAYETGKQLIKYLVKE